VQQQLVRCSYLVAADGAHSVIRWVDETAAGSAAVSAATLSLFA
jgi:2-polyprenyl-6-methoxyphenol hydroxylase-like FAD-dependent oxidoreductase